MSIANVECPRCDLVQPPPSTGRCRRCGTSLVEDSPPDASTDDAASQVALEPPAATVPATADTGEFEPDDAPAMTWELDLPPRPSMPSAQAQTTLGSTAAGAMATTTPSIPTATPTARPSVLRSMPESADPGVSRFFVDPASGVVRAWIVVSMLIVCLASMGIGRLVRMRAALEAAALESYESK